MAENKNGTEQVNSGRIAELYAIQSELANLVVRTMDLHNFGHGTEDTDALLDQLEATHAVVSELIGAAA